MAQMSSLKTVISGAGESDSVGRLAGFGNIFGIIAAALGLLAGLPLIPIPALTWEYTSAPAFEWTLEGSTLYPTLMIAFMGLMAICMLLRVRGTRGLNSKIGSSLPNITWVGVISALGIVIYVWTQFEAIGGYIQISPFLQILYLLGTMFVLSWQIGATIYVDTSKTWVGFLAGLFNALFIPVLALGQVLGNVFIYAAYGFLLVGQLVSLIFWWSPFDSIREFARSPEKAKFAFGLTGLLTFVIGLPAVLVGPVSQVGDVAIWRPWSALASGTTYQTNPALVFSILSLMVFWIMLAPRLGAKELKAAAIGEDIVKGGSKALMLFLVIIGLFATGQAGTF
ncbi:MAG: hypothetical protein ACFFCP_12120, partial [Promethearchaeota archaeon]